MSERVEVKYCRHCGQLIPLTTVNCPYCGRQTIKGEEQKPCPFCGELIKATAIKCKHCGEFLDRRARGAQSPQIVNIEKAVITGGGPQGGVELYRPDGQKISLKPSEKGKLPDRPPLKALPGGTAARAHPGRVPHRPEGSAEALTAPGEAKAPAAPPPGGSQGEAAVIAPEAQYECPACGRYVFEGDRFCENCGRDLSVPKGKPTIPVRGKPYGLTDYALMISAAAPVGILLRFRLGILIALGGTVMGLWCLLRIVLSGGKLEGAGRAVGAIAVGLFWAFLIYWSARPAG